MILMKILLTSYTKIFSGSYWFQVRILSGSCHDSYQDPIKILPRFLQDPIDFKLESYQDPVMILMKILLTSYTKIFSGSYWFQVRILSGSCHDSYQDPIKTLPRFFQDPIDFKLESDQDPVMILIKILLRSYQDSFRNLVISS